MKRAGLFICALLTVIGQTAGQVPAKLKPKPTLPIDCSDYGQPCTGTTCVSQQAEYYCAETQTTYVCENDTQNYTGGLVICCTGKNSCFDCPYNGHIHHYYGYYGVERRYPACVYNP